LLENIALPCSINIGSVNGGLMKRTAATCIAGMRSKTTSRSRIRFLRREDFRLFAFGMGIFAKRLRWRPSATRRDDVLSRIATWSRRSACILATETKHHWRVRVGDYRIIYETADVIRVGRVRRFRHRREI
jgi:mRNA-degrading endonuclease RelE of RelBE toxin-antitoxin system